MTKENTAAKAPDLSIFDTASACAKGFELELVHPITKAPLGVFITVVGKESPEFREHVRAKSNENLRKQFQNQRRGKDVEVPTVEKMEAEAIDLLVVCTKGWRNVEHPTEGPMPFSAENARKVYTEFPAIRAQVDEAIADLENFIKV